MLPNIIRTVQRYRHNLQRSSAIQQGLLNVSIFLVSLFLLSTVTYFVVQDALSARLDESLQQRITVLMEQVESDDWDEDDHDERPLQRRHNILNQKAFHQVFPAYMLKDKKYKAFRKPGYTTQTLWGHNAEDDDEHPAYRILVQQKNGLVFVVGEDDDNNQEIIEIVMSAFLLNGLVALLFTTLLVIYLASRAHRQIRRIEHVLHHAAQGDLKQRIGPLNKNNDLAHVSSQIDTMLARLETSMAAMSDISANIAHELKTPVSRLRHDLITALERSEAGESVDDALNDAYEESTHITETFDALLRIAQIEGGARRANFASQHLDNIISSVMDIYTEVAEDAGMTLILKASGAAKSDQPELPDIQGDKELLIQMLANLIENSIRYCPQGTRIEVSTQLVISDESHPQIHLSIADNGSGIPPTERELVFQRLYRLDKSRSDGRGTGLGLSLVKAIAELHNADIELQDNHPGLHALIKFPV